MTTELGISKTFFFDNAGDCNPAKIEKDMSPATIIVVSDQEMLFADCCVRSNSMKTALDLLACVECKTEAETDMLKEAVATVNMCINNKIKTSFKDGVQFILKWIGKYAYVSIRIFRDGLEHTREEIVAPKVKIDAIDACKFSRAGYVVIMHQNGEYQVVTISQWRDWNIRG